MYSDNRGHLIFPIKNGTYMNKSIDKSKECTFSVNKKNVFRGLHINTFGKLITCILGEFIDIMVNLETLKVEYYHIKQGDQIYCPANYAHGFFSLEENSVLSYHCEGIFGNETGGLLNYRDPILNIKLPEGLNYEDIIINEKDNTAPFLHFDYFLLGSTGFIGSNVLKELKNKGKLVYSLSQRLNEIEYIEFLFQFYKPKYLINCAGLTGKQNIHWCDNNKTETLDVNVIQQIKILQLCNKYNIHCTLLGSGAIFKDMDKATEETEGNDNSTFYSECRILLEKMVKSYSNYLLLRINYPISYKKENLENPKNLLNKLLKYQEIEDISLSITNLDIQIPKLINLIEAGETGILNFVMPGKCYVKDILEEYTGKSIVELGKKLKPCERSSTELIVSKI